MLSIPLECGKDVIGYIILYGDKPFVEFNRRDFDTELAFVKLYIENQKLTEKIKTLIDERERARGEVEKVKKSLFEYIHLLAHDLRKPLTGIIGFSEILRDEFKNLHEADVIEFIKSIRQAGGEMLEMLKCLTEMAEIELKGRSLKLEKVNLSDEINSLVNRLTTVETKWRDLNIIFDVPGGVEIEVDREKFAQIVSNLISNVVKSSHGNSTIKISARETDGWVEMNIEAVDLMRSSQELKTRLKNSNFNLIVVNFFVDLHGGRMEIANGGGGFKVWFPLRSRKAQDCDEIVMVGE